MILEFYFRILTVLFWSTLLLNWIFIPNTTINHYIFNTYFVLSIIYIVLSILDKIKRNSDKKEKVNFFYRFISIITFVISMMYFLLYSNSIMVSDLAVTLNGTTSNSSSKVMGIQFYNNKDLMINSVSYLTQRTDNVTIRKDTGTTYTFTATEQEVLIIKIIIIALPVAVLLAGIIVWQVRRRKK